MNRKPSKKTETIHIRLPKNGDGMVNKEYLCKVAEELSKEENEDINISEVVRRAIGIIIPAMDKNLNLHQIASIIVADDDIAREMKNIKLSDILDDMDRKGIRGDISLLDVYRIALSNGLRYAFENYPFNRLLVEIYKKSLSDDIEERIEKPIVT